MSDLITALIPICQAKVSNLSSPEKSHLSRSQELNELEIRMHESIHPKQRVETKTRSSIFKTLGIKKCPQPKRKQEFSPPKSMSRLFRQTKLQRFEPRSGSPIPTSYQRTQDHSLDSQTRSPTPRSSQISQINESTELSSSRPSSRLTSPRRLTCPGPGPATLPRSTIG